MAPDNSRLTTLVLVLAAHERPYPGLVRTIKRTWASVRVDTVETLFYLGGRELRLDGRDLQLPVPDDLAHAGQKTLACFEYVLQNRDADLIFRTNCSSYVDLTNLHGFVRANAAARGFYCGKLGMQDGVPFASGSGYFLSNDLVQLVVERQADSDHSLLDDVALGALLTRHGVEIGPAPRQDLTNLHDVLGENTSHFHFRCKTASARRNEDAAIMIAVHRAFCRARGMPVRSPALLLPTVARRARGAARKLLRVVPGYRRGPDR